MPKKYTRASQAAVAVKTSVYVFGGTRNENNPTVTNSVLAFDVASQTWDTKLPTMPTRRQDLAAAAISSNIYVIGGCENINNRVDALRLPASRVGSMSLCVNDDILATVEVFRADKQSWSGKTLPDMPALVWQAWPWVELFM